MELPTPPAQRLAPLDVLRAVAVLLVLGRHLPEMPADCAPSWVKAALDTWTRGGWIGVDLFFVLSGFLISGLLFREHARFGTIRYGHFLARRAFKIYPAFYVMFAVTLLWSGTHGRALPTAPVLLSEALFVQNYGPALFPHTWSLAVEEHFYLLLPLTLLALRRPFARLPAVFFAVAVLALAGRAITAGLGDFHYKTHLFPTHLRIDSLLFGVLLSWLHHFHGEALSAWVKKSRWLLAALVAVAALPPFILELGKADYLHVTGLTALYIGAGAALLLALDLRPRVPLLAALGAYSYSIYLWHIPVRFFGLGWLPRDASPLLAAAVFLVESIAVGILAAKLIETPFLKLRDRLFPTRSA